MAEQAGAAEQNKLKEDKRKELMERKAANKPFEELRKQREEEERLRKLNEKPFKQKVRSCCRNCIISLHSQYKKLYWN